MISERIQKASQAGDSVEVAKLQPQLQDLRQMNRPNEASDVSQSWVDGERSIVSACKANGVTDVAQIAYVLATARWETARTMRPIKEAFWLSEEWRKANLKYYPYCGRGYVQLTWKDNYEKMGRLFGVDLVGDPDRALDPALAAKIACVLLRDGAITGRKLSDFIGEGREDFANARRIIGGTDNQSQIAALSVQYLMKLKSNPPDSA